MYCDRTQYAIRRTVFLALFFHLKLCIICKHNGGVMNMLKTFEEKITFAVEKIKMLKEEKNNLVKQLEELEGIIKSKDNEIDKLMLEKASIKTQLEDLFNELDSLEFK